MPPLRDVASVLSSAVHGSLEDHLPPAWCVERGFWSAQTAEWGMLPLRVRRIERVRLHIDADRILAQLANALVRTQVQAPPCRLRNMQAQTSSSRLEG